jgi:hypothetical protein
MILEEASRKGKGILMKQPEPQSTKLEAKKPYVSPILTRYGDIEEITHGALPTTDATDVVSKV